MRKQSWPKRDPIRNYFPLPNEIYSLGLSATAIAIYGYLLRREDRKTYQCLASYRMIGEAIGKSVTTVRKYVCELEERGLIRTETTTVITQDGRKRNGRMRCHILPIRSAIEQFNERQLRAAELAAERWRVQDKAVASYAAPPATTARSAGGFRGTRVGSQTKDKGQIEVAQGQNPLVPRERGDVFGQKGGIFMSKKADRRFPLRLDDLTRWKIEYWYQKDDCQSRNEFVERAVNFYADYLAGQENSILPAAIQSAIDGRLGMFEDRVAKLLYKLTVEMDMGMNAVLDCIQVDDDYLRRLLAVHRHS